jgi:hypothetical protein
MPQENGIPKALGAEFRRLGLNVDEFPGGGLMVGAGSLERLIARLRDMQPGVTWRDVFPNLPAHWMPGQSETWTVPFLPLGPFDYQELPAGPAVHVVWKHVADQDFLDSFLDQAKRAKWPVYGAGLVDDSHPQFDTVHALIVLARGTPEDRVNAFVDWITKQPGFLQVGVLRTGAETYLV